MEEEFMIEREPLSCTLKNPDDVAFHVILGGCYPQHVKEWRVRTLYLAPANCSECGGPPPQGAVIEGSLRSALFVDMPERRVSEQVLAFRSSASAADMVEIDWSIAQSSFPLEGEMRVVIGQVTDDLLFALALLMKPRATFGCRDFRHPLANLRERKAMAFESFARRFSNAHACVPDHDAAEQIRRMMFTSGLESLLAMP